MASRFEIIQPPYIDEELNTKINEGYFDEIYDNFFKNTPPLRCFSNKTIQLKSGNNIIPKILFRLSVDGSSDYCYLLYTETKNDEYLQVLFTANEIFTGDLFIHLMNNFDAKERRKKRPEIEFLGRVYSFSDEDLCIDFARLPFHKNNDTAAKEYGYILINKKKKPSININLLHSFTKYLRTFIQYSMPLINFDDCYQDILRRMPQYQQFPELFENCKKLCALLFYKKPSSYNDYANM